MNRSDVDVFEKLSGQLLSVYEEISLLSKKKPNDAVNKFKLKFINQMLLQSNNFLGVKYKPFDDFLILTKMIYLRTVMSFLYFPNICNVLRSKDLIMS